MKDPDLIIKIWLSEAGYQVKISDEKRDRLQNLRDFSSDKPIKFWQDLIDLKFMQLLDNLRTNH